MSPAVIDATASATSGDRLDFVADPVADPVAPHEAPVARAGGAIGGALVDAACSPVNGRDARESPASRRVPSTRWTETVACFEPKSFRAMASSLTFANRAARSFARQVAMTWSSPAGMLGRKARADGVGSV